jgi:hypothetical protein
MIAGRDKVAARPHQPRARARTGSPGWRLAGRQLVADGALAATEPLSRQLPCRIGSGADWRRPVWAQLHLLGHTDSAAPARAPSTKRSLAAMLRLASPPGQDAGALAGPRSARPGTCAA